MEKNFFMVWIGNEIPRYATYAFDAFKKLNPSFNCDFINFSFNSFNGWDKRLMEYSVEGCPSLTLSSLMKCPNKFKAGCYTSSLVRYWLLENYGGIYADCDTFPIRPFDDLLKLDSPFTISKTKPPKFDEVTGDAFFIGGPKGTKLVNQFIRLQPPIKLYDMNDPKYISMRDRFFSCQLQIGEHYNDSKCYIDHYDSNTYNRHEPYSSNTTKS